MNGREIDLEFRELAESDYPLLLEWLSRPHVQEWWDEREDTLEKIAVNYGEEGSVKRYILLMNADGETRPIGFFQQCSLPEGRISIDQFIGEPDLINVGIGTAAVRQFVEKILDENGSTEIILDPEPENRRAIRCYEKAGFEYYETLSDKEGKRAYMMRFARPVESDTK